MNDLDDRLAALRQCFIDQAATQATQLRAAAIGEDRPALRQLSHSLSGRAGMFGFTHLGEAAQALEEAIDAAATDYLSLAEQLIQLLDQTANGK